MHITIRADILNAALHAVASTSNGKLKYGQIFPNSENDWLTFERLVKEVPALETELMAFTTQWERNRDPSYAFFSIDPPGTWMRLRELIGPDAMDDWDLDEQLDSEEALGVVLQRFLEELEKQQDVWDEMMYIR